MAARDLPECDEHGGKPAEQQRQRFAHHQLVGVVGDVGARRAEVKERAGGGCLLAEVVDVRHHVVTQALLVLRRAIQVGVVQVRPHFRQGRRRDGEPELLLRFHQRQPEPAPQPDSFPVPPQHLHGRGGIALAQRGLVGQPGACIDCAPA